MSIWLSWQIEPLRNVTFRSLGSHWHFKISNSHLRIPWLSTWLKLWLLSLVKLSSNLKEGSIWKALGCQNLVQLLTEELNLAFFHDMKGISSKNPRKDHLPDPWGHSIWITFQLLDFSDGAFSSPQASRYFRQHRWGALTSKCSLKNTACWPVPWPP